MAAWRSGSGSGSSSGAEHRVHMTADGGAGHGQAEVATPERQLNCFVRCVALIERLGNALGTLAFTWATVVLLGGYPTVLRGDHDFWFATAICFLEAFRMFSQHNRMDYQLFFGTRGAFRFLGWSGLVLMVYLNGVVCLIDRNSDVLSGAWLLPLLGILVAIGQFMCPGLPRLLARRIIPLRRAISLWSPMVAIILLALSVLQEDCHFDYKTRALVTVKPVARWTVYAVLLVVVLPVSVSRLRFPSIIKLADIALGRKQEFWRRVVLSLCMVAAIVLATFSLSHGGQQYMVSVTIAAQVSAILLVSFGNFQVPAAVLRVVLPLIRFGGSIPEDYKNNCPNNDATPAPAPTSGDDACSNPAMINLAPSLYIFYGMVLGQGPLYLVACLVEIFSFIPRRFLIHRGGFKGQWGLDSVNLYYAHALEKCMERNVLAPNISLYNFAIDFLNSDSTKRQLHGIRIAHTLLQRDPTRTQLLVKLKASTEMMNTLMRMMLHCTGQENKTTRLFAAMVIDELAKEGLLVINSPGIVRSVSLLLDYGSQRKKQNLLLGGDTDDEKDQKNGPFLNSIGHQMRRGDAVTDDASNEQKSWIARRWQQVSEFWSVPQEGPLTEQDLLPVLGMSIIQSLATYDQSNCAEISKATDLIRKITIFTSVSTSDNKYTDTEKKVLVQSSLKLFYRLTSIHGEIGITLRQKISKHPFLLINLSGILQGDITSNYETRKLAAGIIRNLAVDDSMRLAIGRVRRIITRLMHVFLTPDKDQPSSSSTSASVSPSTEALRKVAGQALAMLAISNVNNCLAMLRHTGYSFIEELTNMIHVKRYRCVAASLLRNVCVHARSELKETDLNQLSFISRVVLERILRAEGEELEIFIGLSSHIYEAIPEEFARDCEYGQIKVTFVKWHVDVLNANMEPNADCPGIRRVILEQAIKLMEYDSSNVDCFRKLHMKVLSTVEETILEAENYTIFMVDVGLMEAGEPLSSLVERAKQLLDVC